MNTISDDLRQIGRQFGPDRDVVSHRLAAQYAGGFPNNLVYVKNLSIRGGLLELGADDYVTKPFSPKELLARVRRAMRRNARTQQMLAAASEASSPHDVLAFGDVEIDFTSMEATRAGKSVSMTAQEFKLLRFLSRSTDRVISREELLNEVWGYQNYPSTRTVDNHVLRLRQKLEPDPSRPRYFVTVHSAGYKFVTGSAPATRKG